MRGDWRFLSLLFSSFNPRRMNSIVSAAKAAATITAGRRAGAPTTLNNAALSSNSPSKEGDDLALGASTSGGTATSGRRSGGAPPATSWGSETTGATGPAFGQTGATSSVKINQRAAAAAAVATSNDDGAAVVIRDDAETIDTEAGQTTSAAPRNQARRVQSLFEMQEQTGSGGLDSRTNNTSKNGNSGGSFASGLDLSLLTSVMSPPDALKEPDEVWVYSKLLQKLSQDIQNEEEDKIEIT